MTPQELKNSYFLLRHGQSRANTRGLIVSDPENGLTGYGLTETGKQQVAQSVRACEALDRQTLIYASDFLRTKETAAIAADILDAGQPVQYSPRLRERFFGDWELTADANYAGVWADDALDREPRNGVEPVTAVLERALACIAELENRHDNRQILLVSHGDTIQILLSWFGHLPPHRHRDVAHMGVAEIRKAW